MFGDSGYEQGDPDEETFDPVDNLTGDDPDEFMQTGYSPPEREPHHLRDFPTAAEELRGPSLDQALAAEEPDVGADDAADDAGDAGDFDGRDFDGRDFDEAEPRAGRLVAPNEGFGPDEEADEIATDVGPAGYAASAEEAAMHIVADDDDDGSGPADA